MTDSSQKQNGSGVLPPHADSERDDPGSDIAGTEVFDDGFGDLFGYLESAAGREAAGHARALLEKYINVQTDKVARGADRQERVQTARLGLEQERERHRFQAQQHSATLQVVGLVTVLLVVCVLAYGGQIQGQLTVGLLGSLAGYFAGKNSAG